MLSVINSVHFFRRCSNNSHFEAHKKRSRSSLPLNSYNIIFEQSGSALTITLTPTMTILIVLGSAASSISCRYFVDPVNQPGLANLKAIRQLIHSSSARSILVSVLSYYIYKTEPNRSRSDLGGLGRSLYFLDP